jgi:lipopolysaccharide biosynthesis glycosyltransferase
VINTVVSFVTDNGYLVPSLVAAKQLLERKIHEIADIIIYTVDVDNNLIDQLSNYSGNNHIRFEPLTSKRFVPPEGTVFRKSHISVTALARLCLHEVVPAKYENIVYLDGDVQIADDISQLVRFRVPDQKILAGRSSAWLSMRDQYNNIISEDYLVELGGVTPEGDFNSGVLAFRRETWINAAPKALTFFFENSAICILHDQSALNAIFKDNVLFLPPKYNFHHVYSELYVQNRYAPAIVHFTGPQKPWHYFGPPWGKRFHRSYVGLLREQPWLSEHLQVTTDKFVGRRMAKFARSSLSEAKRLIKYRDILRTRREKFFAYVRETEFPVI